MKTVEPVEVSAVLINYKTPDLLARAITSLRQFYPTLSILIIDNGSGDDSASIIKELQRRHPGLTTIQWNGSNLHHGPAMDQALHLLTSRYLLFIDSDCKIFRGGFVEAMLTIMHSSQNVYAVGKRVWMNRRGFDSAEGAGAIPYIRPICMLVRREMYLTLPPFERHGSPCLRNMEAASKRGLALVDFPVEEYVKHEGRGTAGRVGYGLGWKGKLNYLLNKLGL